MSVWDSTMKQLLGREMISPPWKVGNGGKRIIDSKGYDVAYATGLNAEESAALIAEAPDLLEIAKCILADDMIQYLPVEFVARVRATIAKATQS